MKYLIFLFLSFLSIKIYGQKAKIIKKENGIEKLVYQVRSDDESILNGFYQYYYNNTLQISGTFYNNFKNGIWIYMPDKDFKIIAYYYMDEKDSIWTVFKNDTLISEINYNTHRSIAYYDGNNVMFTRDSIDGKKIEKLYFRNSKLKSELIYEKSGEDWDYKEYNENGDLVSNIIVKNELPYSINNTNVSLNRYEGYIIDGTGQFNTIEYDLMEKKSFLSQTVNIVKGKLHGEYISFFKDGEIRNQGNFKDGFLTGTWKISKRDGFKTINYNLKDSIREDTINHIYYSSVIPNIEIFNEPRFLNGPADNFRFYIAKTMKYPEIAEENGIQGKVYVSFIINSSGETSDLCVLKKIDPVLDKEALRVIKDSPLWRPGCINNIPVKVKFTFPLNFVLQ